MKIKINNLSKNFGNCSVLKNINLDIEDNKFYCILGESGSGKTTFLNILSFLETPNKGTKITYDGVDYSITKENLKRDFSSKNIGYIFQSFNLFEDDTVYNNIYLVLSASSRLSARAKKTKILEVLEFVGLSKYVYAVVKNLSGGEKQRVAIARALVNNPGLILADEPTGALDSTNANNIYEILNKISAKCTVICISHERDLAEKYCDEIYDLKDGHLEHTKSNNLEKNAIISMKEKRKNSKAILQNSFIIKHILNGVKQKKISTFISVILFSLSLFFGELSVYLNSGISETIRNAFSSVINGNSIICKRKNDDSGVIDYSSLSENEVKNVYLDYKSDLDYYGVSYLVNFEEFFKSENSVFNVSRPNAQLLEGFNARSFNEFIYVKDFNKLEDVFPRQIRKLLDDEVILSMNYSSMKKVCEYLQIVRTFESLGEYIGKNDKFVINIKLANYDWNYEDNISFKVKGVISSNESRIYHTDNKFNERFFENTLLIPSSLNFNSVEYYPWVMKKVYYVKTKKFQTTFLNKIKEDRNYKNIIFDPDNINYSPKSCNIETPSNSNKLFLFNSFSKTVENNVLKVFEGDDRFDQYYYSTSGGYMVYGDGILSGFSSPTFFSINKDRINEMIDACSKISIEEMLQVKNNDVLVGNILMTGNDAVRFTTCYDSILSGDLPINYDEICISSGIASKLNARVGDELYLSTMINAQNNLNNFRTIKIKICGILNNDKNLIYQNPDFSVILFRDLFKVSAFSLIPNAIVFELNEPLTNEEIEKLNNTFLEYSFVDPFKELDLGVNDTIRYIEIVLYSLSAICIIASIILLLTLNAVDIDNTKRDFAVLSILGFRNSEISKLVVVKNILFSIISFAISCLIMVEANLLFGNYIFESLGIVGKVTLSLSPYLFGFVVLVAVSLLTSLLSIGPIKNIKICDELH